MKKLTYLTVLLSFLFLQLATLASAAEGADTNASAGQTNSQTADANTTTSDEAPPDEDANATVAGEPYERTSMWKEIVYGAGFVFVSMVFLYFGKLLFDLVTPFSLDSQLTEKDNPAMGVVLTGYLLAIIVVICGVMMSGSNDGEAAEVAFTFEAFAMSLGEIAAYTAGGILLLLLSGIINDKLILNEFSNTHEISERGNCGVAVIIAAGFVGSGLIIAGTVQGSLDWLSAIIGFVAGQTGLVLFAKMYQRATSYDDQLELHQRQNLAVGLAFAGNILAYSLLLMKGLTMSGGETVTTNDQLWHFGYYALVGIVTLPLLRIVNDKLFLPGVNLADEIVEDRNVNAGLLEAGLAVSMAGILIACM